MKYNNQDNSFHKELKESVDAYFAQRHIAMSGDWRLYTKAIILTSSALLLYVLWIFIGTEWFVWRCLISALLGLNFAFIGFNIMHDASHRAFSSKDSVNRLVVRSLDLMGASSYLWNLKHVILHHTYTNTDMDDDIQAAPFLRLSPSQKKRWFHRYQAYYAFFLYATLYVLWVLVKDPMKYLAGKVNGTRLPPMPFKEHVIFFLSKIGHVFFLIVLPCMLFGTANGILFYLIMAGTCGLVISTIFQLAHVNEKSQFPEVDDNTGKIEKSWAESQVEETCDFASGSIVANWTLGGLNHQTIHHLFPRISHVHYRSIREIIVPICKKYGVPYQSLSFPKIIWSHLKTLNRLGKA